MNSIFFTSNEGSPLDVHLWTMRLDGPGKRSLTEAKGTHQTTVSPGGQSFTDEVSTLDTPPSVRLCGTESGEGCKALWQSKPAPDASGTKSQIVTSKAADGTTTIYGQLTQPSGASKTHSVPIILNPYGGPLPWGTSVGERWGGLFDKLMAQHGFAILTVDNRGSGGRGRDFEQANYRNLGAVQLADQMAALDQVLAADTSLDPDRVGWWGWSWGRILHAVCDDPHGPHQGRRGGCARQH